MCHEGTTPGPSTARGPPTLAVQADVHDAVLDLHVPAQVALEVKLAGAVGALEGLAARVQVHVAQQVVHAVEGLPAHLEHTPGTVSPQGIPLQKPAPAHLCGQLQSHPLQPALVSFFPLWPQRPERQSLDLLLHQVPGLGSLPVAAP